MFLNSLSERQIANFSQWVNALFGYSVRVSRASAGHLSINLTEGSADTNIVDTGYGVSQILPVLGQLWWARNGRQSRGLGRSTSNVSLVAIEQPELHLHPAHQALLADAFGSILRKTNDQSTDKTLRILIETHSEVLINRFGQLIADGTIGSEDIQILIFDAADGSDRLTEVKVARYDNEGRLENWPFGFFEPSI